MSRAAAEVGSTANSYQILAKLASGGMAEIFLARGEGVAGVERYCVLKRILRDRASDVQFVQMFLDEARLAAQLQHPNIAQVHDIGKLGDSYFFTMEYVHGETVRALLQRAQGLRRPLPINAVLTIVAGAAAGLHHAHVRVGRDGRPLGIVHRDVSPSNLMVSYEGSVKLVDFGVAKAADRAHETKSGTVKGKISYLSPEQCRGQRVDRRSDLFSLGICFWEMLTCDRLYRRASDFENMNAIATEVTPPPSARRPDVPPEVDALVLRLLAKDVEDRFQTAGELVEEIEAVAARTGSVLSATGLGRLVRELFGQRPEPWLELEGHEDPVEAVTVTSEPIPRELAMPPADRIDHQLSSVVDLSAPRAVTESLSVGPPERITAQLGKTGRRGFPLAAPPLTQPGVSPLAASQRTGSWPGEPPAVATAGPEAVRSMPARTGPASGTLSSASLVIDGTVQSSGEIVRSVPTAAAAAVPRSGPHALPSSPSGVPAAGAFDGPPGPAAHGLAATGSGSAPGTAAGPHGTLLGPHGHPSALLAGPPGPPGPSGAHGALLEPQRAASRPSGGPGRKPGMAGARGGRAWRPGWPLYAVIGGAALVGSIAVVLLMSSPPGAGSEAAGPGGGSAAPVPAPQVAAPGPGAAAVTVTPIEVAEGAGDRAPVAAAGAAAPDPAAAHPAGPAGPNGAAGVSGGAGGPGGAGAAGEAGGAGAGGVPHRRAAASSGPRAAGKGEVGSVEIPRDYAAGRYGKVVERCTAAAVASEQARLCFLAACHVGDEAAARRLITAVPAADRDRLAGNCRQLGVDVKREDCEADPTACQH